jgi:hypothetical protein
MFQELTPQTAPFTWHSPEPQNPNFEGRIVFAVPAKDEEDQIAACLTAFEAQVDAGGQPLNASLFEVLLLVNNTTDDTISRALAARRHPGNSCRFGQPTPTLCPHWLGPSAGDGMV